ncbi:MAG: flagellar hook-associated protein FlgK [Deltaproteobacteria bacterium]|nr:flagellar hook-associated protein FlgK [Deltaproteobacteria bacterium]
MSGIGLILNAAKDALMSQQYALDVISHNVANANTEGYSRQTPVLSAKTPAPYAGFILGRGVELSEVIRNTDSFIESRLRERNSDLTAMSEKEVYLNALEGVFNENSGRSLSAQFADFWNAWHDLSNNPSGYAERDVVVEMGSLLAQSFKDLAGDMQQFEREIGLALDSGITKINQLTSQIADVNEQIINLEIIGSANDLRDKRDALVIELSKYINIKAFENEDGNLTVMTTSGYTLVDKSSTYQLELSGTNIMWEGSGGVDVNITDSIEGGKMGGWLDMRDEILPKYEADLDELAKAAIWEVNKIHTQGVGLEIVQPGDSLTGTYTSSTTLSDLNFGSKIDYTGSFTLWIGDANGENLQDVTISLATLNGSSTLTDLATSINNQISTAGLSGVTASVSNDALVLTADATHSFAFSDDSSYILAAVGINSFFKGSSAQTMDVNSLLKTNKEFVAAARVNSTTGAYEAGDNSNALAMTNLQYNNVSLKRWTYERGQTASSQNVSDTLENYLHTLVGSIGIKTQSIAREKEYNQVIVDQLNATRDGIAAVSLDEEMTNLIKYQHGYAAAAKLISTADEMLKTLLDTR